MTSLKQIRLAEKVAAEQRTLISELNNVGRDIERCERLITDLKEDLDKINAQFQGPRTTREDIAYLSGLLACAKRKLAWEKQLGSLQKRTPLLLERMTQLLGDPANPPTEEVRADMLRALQVIQSAMERLQNVAK